MKLSDKILMGLLVIIFLYLTAAFAELRITGTPKVIHDDNSVAETAVVPAIGYLVLDSLDRHVSIIPDDNPRLEVRSLKGDHLKQIRYTLSGDTLSLSRAEAKKSGQMIIRVYVPKNGFRGVTVNNSIAVIENMQQDLLKISQNGSRMWLSASDIKKIDLNANDSYIDISSRGLDTLTADIQSSEVQLSTPVGVLEGSMEESSFLRLMDVEELKFKKDASSRLNMYQ